jgi:hypothetical protein
LVVELAKPKHKEQVNVNVHKRIFDDVTVEIRKNLNNKE